MSDQPNELTRERLREALIDWSYNGTMADAESLWTLKAAAERLMAEPSTNHELTSLADAWNDEFHGSAAEDEVLYAYQDGIRNTERRLLLPFADTPAGAPARDEATSEGER